MVGQLNVLISDKKWWNLDHQPEAEGKFDKVVTDAFFDGIEIGKADPSELREGLIPLPTRAEGYAHVMLVGTTGAGKTTLLRHIIGSDHRYDRFPSTSTARTTIADTEIITADGTFEAAVTFMPRHEVRMQVEECVENACIATIEGKTDKQIADALLTHSDQRFRMSYIIGDWQDEEDSDTSMDMELDFSLGDNDDREDELAEDEGTTKDELESIHARLRGYIARVKSISKVEENLWNTTSVDHEEFTHKLSDNNDFPKLVSDIMDDIQTRFAQIGTGDFEKTPTDDWPLVWYYTNQDREGFLKQVRWFSSNHHGQFGRLLTPLVNGVRVRGPFYPKPQTDDTPRLVLMDGQGLGHTAQSVSSISTHITRQFPKVDLILLVDNAQQPMQAAPLALLRSLGSSGYASKLAVAFTHFDSVEGDNLRSTADKKAHVLGGVNTAIANLRYELGDSVVRILDEQLNGGTTFFLAYLDKPMTQTPPGSKQEMNRLMQLMQESAVIEELGGTVPIYHSYAELDMMLRDAVEAFMDQWQGRLGIKYSDMFQKEHWTRVKALSRRFANQTEIEYDNLKPVADLINHLQVYISQWLDNPNDWKRKPENQQERDEAIASIRRAMYSAIDQFAESRLKWSHLTDWETAYEFKGTGSSYRRADVIDQIYRDAAPVIRSNMDDRSRQFRNAIGNMIHNSLKNYEDSLKES